MNKGTQKRGKKRILLAVEIAALCAGLLCLGLFALQQRESAEQVEAQEELRRLFETGQSGPSGWSLFATAAAEEAEKPISQRMSALYSVNPDTVGWLEAGSEISNVVTHRDNEYYLDHDFYGKKSSMGTLFTDEENADCAADRFVIVYGHNMRNGTMFGKLPRYEELSYFKENPLITMTQLRGEEIRQYIAFAAVDASMISGNHAFFHLRRFQKLREGGDEAMAEFIREIGERSLFKVPGIEVDERDDLICLVTCTYQYDDGRLLLFGRALREGETAQEMIDLVGASAQKR